MQNSAEMIETNLIVILLSGASKRHIIYVLMLNQYKHAKYTEYFLAKILLKVCKKFEKFAQAMFEYFLYEL